MWYDYLSPLFTGTIMKTSQIFSKIIALVTFMAMPFMAIANSTNVGESASPTVTANSKFNSELTSVAFVYEPMSSQETRSEFNFGDDEIRVNSMWTLSGNTYLLAEKDLYRQNFTELVGAFWYFSGVFGQEVTKNEDWRSVAGLGVGVGYSNDEFFIGAGAYALARINANPDFAISGSFGFKF